MLSGIRDDRDRFLVISSQCSKDLAAAGRAKLHSFPDPKVEHRAVGSRLVEKAETRYNFVIQFDEFLLGERINIDMTHLFNLRKFPASFIPGFLVSFQRMS